MIKRYNTPGWLAATRLAAAIPVGAIVGVYAEPLEKYGSGRRTDTYLAKVVGRVILPGSTVHTGRLLVETRTECHYQKAARRGGTRTYQFAPCRPRTLSVWPWDLVLMDPG